MKIVGLKIEKGLVAATVVEKGLRHTELRDFFSQSFATDAELVDILRDRARSWSGGRIVSSIPGGRFSQRIIALPFGDRKRVERALPFELEDSVPFPLDDVELDYLILDGAEKGVDKKRETSVLGIMLPKAVLRQHLELLASAGIDPQVVAPSYLGLYFFSRTLPVEGTAALIDGNDLCVKSGELVKACRSFAGPQAAGGLGHSIKALETESGAPIEKAYLLSAEEGLEAALAELGFPVESISPEFNGKKAEDPVSLGLALSEQVNFRKGAFSYRPAERGARRMKRTLIVAGAITAALAAANIGVKLYLVESSYGKLDQEIKSIYRQAVPDAKVPGDPVREIHNKIDEATKKFGVLGTGTSALDVMKAVTEGIPKEVRVSFQEFILEGDSLKLQGDATSFEAVDKMKAELQKSPLFAEVKVLDTRMGVDSKVKFRFEMKLKQAM
ncbi:MAG TPA: PilN domain-containing protein [Nitrospirota bacterium]